MIEMVWSKIIKHKFYCFYNFGNKIDDHISSKMRDIVNTSDSNDILARTNLYKHFSAGL